MDAKFVLYNYAGKPKTHYLVKSEQVKEEAITTVQQVSHHVLVVDRSGSMYSSMADLKNTLLKLLTLEEYESAEMLVSLISYSSLGDTTVHFQRVKVEEVMRPDSPQQASIKKLRVTGLTCISQALKQAAELVQPDEITAISLHSDGYANDRSATAESRELDKICREMGKMPNVFINTIAYSKWSDFKLLSRIANSMSGTCVQAKGIKQVFDALHNTSDLLAGQVTPAMDAPIGDADYQVFFSGEAMKINGSDGDMVVRGLRPEDDKTIYKYYVVDEATYNNANIPVIGQNGPGDLGPVLSFARANLAEGNLNTAKYAMVSSRDVTLLNQHAKALTNQEIVNFASDLEEVLFMDELDQHEFTENYGLNVNKISLLELLDILAQHSADLQVDLNDLSSRYVRRSVRRIPGTRDEEGNLVEPWLKTEYLDKDTPYAQVQSFDINRNTANINMLVTRKVQLVQTDDGTLITDVAGIKVNPLTSYNNYTLVGDGSLNVPSLKVRIGSKKLFRALSAAEVVSGDFKPTEDYVLNLAELPLVSFNQEFSNIDGAFEEIAALKVISSIMGASLKGESDTFTRDQIDELKRHYLSTSLYINFPTVNEYTDLNEALNEGKIDTRLSYKVDIGNKFILNQSKLHSANKFLDRMFTVEVAGDKIKKPKFDNLLKDGVVFGYKKLSARTKITEIDNFMKPIFEDFLGLADNNALSGILAQCGAEDLVDDLKGIATGKVRGDDAVEVMTQVRRKAEGRIRQIFRSTISPLIFYVGATGLLPDEFDTKALTADELTGQFPGIKIAKAELEGTFFLLGETILSVYIKNEYFTPK